MMRTILMIFLLPLAESLRAEEDKVPLELQLLREKRDAAVRTIDVGFKSELEKLMAVFTKRADLDAAISVREAIEHLAKKGGDEASKPSGKWAITHTDPEWTHGYWFDGNTARRIDPSGKTLGADSKLVLENGDGLIRAGDRIERVTLTGSILFIEHFYPASSYPNKPPSVMGRGVLMKKR